MLRVSLRTVLLYNFGLALIFLAIGALSAYSFELAHPKRGSQAPAFTQKARDALVHEENIEALRARSLYYFDLSSTMRQMKIDDAERLFNDVRVLSFSVAALFVLNALLAAMLAASRKPEPTPPAESGR